jgi:transcriptional regulator with XRE-family HTH domain
MKRNAKLEARRKKIPQDVKIYVDLAFKLADQIDFILKKQGKTQRELAQELGKSESEISKWLTGEHNFTIRSIAKLQAILKEPIVLFPFEVEKKIEAQMHVFVFSGTPSSITTAVVGKKKAVSPTPDVLDLFSPTTAVETVPISTIPFMN